MIQLTPDEYDAAKFILFVIGIVGTMLIWSSPPGNDDDKDDRGNYDL